MKHFRAIQKPLLVISGGHSTVWYPKQRTRMDNRSSPAERASVVSQTGEPQTPDYTDPSGQVFTKLEMHRGALPHPDLLVKYENLQPGLADTIVEMAKDEQGHRHRIDQKLANSIASAPYMVTALAFVSIAAAVYLATQGAIWTSLVIGPSGVAPTFLWRFWSKSNETD